MGGPNFIKKSKDDYREIIEVIKSDSPVGIDAQLTHAIIIDYLRQLTDRVEQLEELMKNKN